MTSLRLPAMLADTSPLLMIPVVVVTTLTIAVQIYRFVVPAKTADAALKRVPRTSTKPFSAGASHFDTHGGFITSWSHAPSHHIPTADTPEPDVAVQAGWLNMLFAIVTTYIVANAAHYSSQFHSIFPDNGAFAWQIAAAFPALLRDNLILGAAYLVFTFGYTRAYAAGWLPSRVAHVMQAVGEVGMTVGCVYYARTRTDWPVSQRFAWLMQCIVLTMKMHSYITVNRHLAVEVARGGPGTGSNVYGITHVEVSNKHGTQGEQETVAAAASPHGLRRRRGSTPRAQLLVPPPISTRAESPIRTASCWSSCMRALRRAVAFVGEDVHSQIDTTVYDVAAAQGRVSGVSMDITSPAHAPLTPYGNHSAAAVNGKHANGSGDAVATYTGVTQDGRIARTTARSYPHNLTLADLIHFSFAPTLCYDPAYPLTQSIRPGYICEKVLLALGLITLGIYVLSQHVLPVVHGIRDLSAVDAVMHLLGPMTALVLICFFVVFECVLNAFAELTYFADRRTYEEWWNSSTFLEFSRRWNVPVHTFLLRHVYLDTMRRLGLSADVALYVTFLVSIIAHEVIIYGVLGPTLPYLALFSLSQFPLATIMRYTIFKGKRLGNLIFWFGITWGVTLLFVLYTKEFCTSNPDAC